MICSRCIYSDEMFQISFDDHGVCNYCKQIDQLVIDYGTKNNLGKKNYFKLLMRLKKRVKIKNMIVSSAFLEELIHLIS